MARASARGLEVEGAVATGKAARLSAGATLLRTRVEDAGFDTGSGATFVRGAPLLRRPSRAGRIAFSTMVLQRTTLDIAARHIGARDDRDFATFPATPVRLPAHTRVDLSLGRAVAVAGASAVRAHVRVENVLGARYQEVANFPAPGRTLAVDVRLTPP